MGQHIRSSTLVHTRMTPKLICSLLRMKATERIVLGCEIWGVYLTMPSYPL